MTKADEFVRKYVDIDEEIKKKFNISSEESGFFYLESNRSWRYLKEDLRYCRELRNFFVHRRNISDDYPVQPTDQMICFLDSLIEKIRNPITASSIMVKINDVYVCKREDRVRPAMKTMEEKQFTHVPIVNEIGNVEGVFSENTLLTYLIDEEIVSIDDNTVFKELSKYLPLEFHKSESFKYISKDMMLSDIRDIFSETVIKGDRIGMLFVTNSGSRKEKPLGIITAWDVAGSSSIV